MARVKVSDLRDVKEYAIPLLRTTESGVVHISRQYGRVPDDGPYTATDCGSLLKCSWTYQPDIEGWESELCAQCGNQEDFERVWRECLEFWKERRRKYNEKRDLQMQAHKAEMAAMSLRLNGLMDLLSSRLGSKAEAYYFDVGNLALVGNGDGYTRAIRFEYGGRVYEIQEVEQ